MACKIPVSLGVRSARLELASTKALLILKSTRKLHIIPVRNTGDEGVSGKPCFLFKLL